MSDSTLNNNNRFHLAFPVSDLEQTRRFYCDGLGCEVGRESKFSLILNLGGHQLVAQMSDEPLSEQAGIYPRHFGLVFDTESDWQALRDRAIKKGLEFRVEPKARFVDLPLEHSTFFLQDPSFNLLEFKFYRNAEAVFGLQEHSRVGDR